MAYKVIKQFVDLQDKNHKYDVGDTYPRKGLSVLPSRINELASADNRQHTPLIQEDMPDEEKRTQKEKKNSAGEAENE